MALCIPSAASLVAVALFIAGHAGAQTAPRPSTAARTPVDLAARLKEVQSSPAQTESLYKTGRGVAGFCANCHGDGGNSVKPDVPNLAGQNAYYLLQQLREFTGTERKTSEFKRRLVNAMTADEKVGMVVFYAAQPVTHKPAANAALAKRGGDLYAKACSSCHDADGRGAREYSRVAGQQPDYLTFSLKGYRDGTGARINKEMAQEIRPMSDADIAAIVAYVSSMK
jgi:cytochrome c553